VEVLRDQLPPGSLDEVLVLFPDPWHKKRHHKRRLVNASFASLVASRLGIGGRLHLATDWEHYAVHMLGVLDAEPLLRNRAGAGGFVPRDEARAPTRFERRGERLGHAVFDLEYVRV
jgi:tRNA (guanine-N7-)-methyltransferase